MYKAFLHLAAVLVLSLVFLSTDLPTAECFRSSDAVAVAGRSNATRIADSLPDDEEFLMESETSRRILQAGKGKTIVYPTLNQNKAGCNGDKPYGAACNGKPGPAFSRRKCDRQNLCDRGNN